MVEEVVLEKAKILRTVMNGHIIFNHWRLSKVSAPCIIRSEGAVNAHVLNVPSDNTVLFSNVEALRALHDHLGYLLLYIDPSNAMDAGHIAGPIVTLA